MNHAQARAFEHHGLDLERMELRQIAREIGITQGILLGRGPGTTERWLVNIRGTAIRLVFCPKSCRIITILPHGRKPRGFYNRKVKAARRRKWRR